LVMFAVCATGCASTGLAAPHALGVANEHQPPRPHPPGARERRDRRSLRPPRQGAMLKLDPFSLLPVACRAGAHRRGSQTLAAPGACSAEGRACPALLERRRRVVGLPSAGSGMDAERLPPGAGGHGVAGRRGRRRLGAAPRAGRRASCGHFRCSVGGAVRTDGRLARRSLAMRPFQECFEGGRIVARSLAARGREQSSMAPGIPV
jgi:hypothetical protein